MFLTTFAVLTWFCFTGSLPPSSGCFTGVNHLHIFKLPLGRDLFAQQYTLSLPNQYVWNNHILLCPSLDWINLLHNSRDQIVHTSLQYSNTCPNMYYRNGTRTINESFPIPSSQDLRQNNPYRVYHTSTPDNNPHNNSMLYTLYTRWWLSAVTSHDLPHWSGLKQTLNT